MIIRLTIACIIAIQFTATAAQAPVPRNILFILSDDQRADTIAAYGNPNIDTPNLDKLVERGFSFRRNYCMGSPHGAVCTPSRAMMMSGQAYFRIPMDLEGVTTFPERFRAAGYDTFITGKWHNEPASLKRAFDHGAAVMIGGMANHEKVPLVDLTRDDDLINARTGGKFSCELHADAAIEYLTQQPAQSPFFAYVALSTPHDPRMAPKAYLDRYYARRPPLPANFMPQHPFDNGRLVIRDENLAPWPRTEGPIRDQLAEYYALISFMDEQIGRILDALAQSPHAENTLVVFASDSGLAVGSHGLLGKQNIYEHSMRAPLIFAGPGIPHGESHALTYLLDIMPTVVDALGLTVSDRLDGQSLAPIWRGTATNARESIFLAYEDLQRALVEDRWKLIVYPKINHVQLFDLASDPDELNNLADDPKQQRERVPLMIASLLEQSAHFGAESQISVDHPAPKFVDLTGTPRKPDQWQPQWIVEKYFKK